MARLLLLLAAALMGSLGFSAGVSAQEVKLRLASFLPATAVAGGLTAKRWVDEVNRRGKGIVQIDFVGPEAVPVPEQPNAVKTGVVDFHSGPGTFYRGALIEGEALTLSDYTVPELRKNGAWDYLNKMHAEKMNVTLITGFGDGVNFHIYTNKPANVADKATPFAGITLRGPPVYKAFFESLGAKVVFTAPGEVFTALERNMVQGYGWPAWGIRDMGWLKMTKYRYDPGFYNVSVAIMVNNDRWKTLNKQQQDLIMDVAKWGEAEWPKWRAELSAQEEKIQKDGGVQVISLGPQLRERAYDAFWNELLKSSPQHIGHLMPLMRKK